MKPEHTEDSRAVTATELKQLQFACMAVEIAAYPRELYKMGGVELDQFCSGEQEALRDLIRRDKIIWQAANLNSDDTKASLHRIDRKLGEWMMRCVLYNGAEALGRLATLIKILHEGEYDGTFKRRITPAELRIKYDKKGRPRGDTDPYNLFVIFASAMVETLRQAVERGEKLRFEEVRNTVDAFQGEFTPDNPRMSSTQFDRCLQRFHLEGLVIKEHATRGPKRGSRQLARAKRGVSSK